MDDVPLSPLALAVACAALIEPELGQQALANTDRTITTQSLPSSGIPVTAGIDRHGNQYEARKDAAGGFNWTRGAVLLSENASKPAQAHEAGHALQYLAGMTPGAPNSDHRRAIERQAYNIEQQAPYQCLTFRGGWDEDKLGPLARKLTQGAK